jgi:hypothetical protein
VYSRTKNYNHHKMKNEEIFYFDPRICVIGPVNPVQSLVRQFSKRYKTTAFEINGGLLCSNNIEDVRRCNFFIIAVSTPDDLKTASETVGKVISGGDIVVYDSTLLPGAMEDNSIHLIEKVSGLECSIQFFACYREHKAGKVSKTICGGSPEVCKIIDEIYSSVTTKSIVFDSRSTILKALPITLLIFISSMFFKSNAQELVVKTNLPYLLTTTPNIGVEYAFARNFSFELTGGYNPFKFGEDARIKHWVVWPELRYWTYESLNGHFFGLHGVGGAFNVGGWDLGIDKLSPLKTKRYQGTAYGAGISYGYSWIIENRWALEFTAGHGMARFEYDSYSLNGDGFQVGQGKKKLFWTY